MNRLRLKEIHREAAMSKLKYKSYELLTQVLPEHWGWEGMKRNWKVTSRVKLSNAMASSVTTPTQQRHRLWQPRLATFYAILCSGHALDHKISQAARGLYGGDRQETTMKNKQTQQNNKNKNLLYHKGNKTCALQSVLLTCFGKLKDVSGVTDK